MRSLLRVGLIVLLFNLFFSIVSSSPLYTTVAFAIIFLVVYNLKKYGGYIKHLWLGGSIVLILMIVVVQPKAPTSAGGIESATNTVRKNLEDLGEKIPTNIQPAKQDRPITYLERPVGVNDPWQIRAGTSLRVLFHYFIKTIIPYPLAFYYGYKFIAPEKITEPIPIISFALYVFLVLMSLFFLKRNLLISFGIGVYLITILPFSNFYLGVPGIVGDRFLLVPSLGWCIVLTVILFKIWKVNYQSANFTFSAVPNGLKISLGVILSFYSVISFARNFDWKDDLTLFRHDIKYVDQSAQAHNLLALHLMKEAVKNQNPVQKTELIKEALVHFKSAISIYPSFFNATYDMGRVYMELNMPDSAIWAFKRALTIDTSFYTIQANIGNLLFDKGEYREAVPYLGYIIRVSPYEYTGYDKLSFAYFKLNEFGKSLEVNREAIRKIPLIVDPYVNIGRTYLGMQQTDSARYYFQKANEMSPGNPMVQQLLQQIGNR
jgi:tetratricopeptide (TPR) repeat protein